MTMARRQVVLDTETTGLSADTHRIIEIGCVEMVNRRLTGKTFHHYLEPDRAIDIGAQKVHGITNAFLKGKPRFKQIAEPLLDFLEGAELIIHNAPFDTAFMNAELARIGVERVVSEYYTIIDTLSMARKKHPGQKNNLDALCKRYQVNNEHREWHGALLDAQILAEVYLAMTAGQEVFVFEDLQKKESVSSAGSKKTNAAKTPLVLADNTELSEHYRFLKKFQ